ncbi:MAG: response regulator [Anaerolineae bacterium]|nr:response regulator [Anaerolineae bacterium]
MAAKEKITLLIVDDISETRENLRKLLYFEPDIEIVGMAASGREAIEKAKALQPSIVLMDINMPDMDGITASQQMNRVAPVCQVIMMSVQSEADYLRRSMLAGAMDFLTKPFTSEELSSSIHRVYEMGASRRAAAPAGMAIGEGMPGSPEAGAPARRPQPGGKLLLVYSPKGGTGCSTVAINTAVALHQVTSKKVALVDASLQFGDVGVLLDLRGSHSIADVVTQIDTLDVEQLLNLMSPHQSGIKVLPAPPAPEMAEVVTADHLKTIVGLLRKEFAYIVLDTWRYLDDTILSTMEQADRIMIVMAPEVPSLKSTKQLFDTIEALQLPTDRIDLVLNQVLAREGIRPENIEDNLKHAIAIQLPFDTRIVRQAANRGLPLIMIEPNHPLAQSFVVLARQEIAALEPQPVKMADAQEAGAAEAEKQEPKKRPGLLGRLKR